MTACCSRQLGRVVQAARAARDSRGGALRQWLHHEAGGNAAEPQGRRAHYGLPNVAAAPVGLLRVGRASIFVFRNCGEGARGTCGRAKTKPFNAQHTVVLDLDLPTGVAFERDTLESQAQTYTCTR